MHIASNIFENADLVSLIMMNSSFLRYPPLTGGMIATSSPACTIPSPISTYSRFTATATEDKIFFCFNFGCKVSSVSNNCAIDISAASSVKVISSEVLPVASFAEAK